ncbi:MAG TPA: alpha/beta hydrolase [Thermoleophilaceae bacterium]
MPSEFEATGAAGALRGDVTGDGPPIVLLHGLTATRRYVTMGSKGLPRAGYRTIAYDARGHGESHRAEDRSAYGYGELVADLEAVLDDFSIERAALAGVSMGAHTAASFALLRPDRVAALVLITPAYNGHPHTDVGSWDRLADGLERDGVDGFLEAWGARDVADRWREAALENARQRLERHRDPAAVADALRVVPRSTAFEGLDALREVEAPALVVGSRDDADPTHRLGVAERWVERMPRAELLVEDEGSSPLAWQGARLSRAMAGFLGRSGWGGG